MLTFEMFKCWLMPNKIGLTGFKYEKPKCTLNYGTPNQTEPSWVEPSWCQNIIHKFSSYLSRYFDVWCVMCERVWVLVCVCLYFDAFEWHLMWKANGKRTLAALLDEVLKYAIAFVTFNKRNKASSTKEIDCGRERARNIFIWLKIGITCLFSRTQVVRSSINISRTTTMQWGRGRTY